jgi:hypothetical protein
MEEEPQQNEANEAHPNEGEIEEAVEDVDLSDSPEDVSDDDDPGGDNQT